MCRSIKLTSLRGAAEDFKIPNFGQLFRTQIEEDWVPEDCRLVLGYDQNIPIDRILNQLQNGLCTTINHFTTVLLFSVWDLIAR